MLKYNSWIKEREALAKLDITQAQSICAFIFVFFLGRYRVNLKDLVWQPWL